MQKVLSCQDRLEKIVADILLDMEMKDRLKSGHGNAMLVAGSIYEACKFYELRQDGPQGQVRHRDLLCAEHRQHQG